MTEDGQEESNLELSIKDDQIANLEREKEEAKKKEGDLKQLYKEQLNIIALLQKELSRGSSSWLDIFVPFAVWAGLASDRDLKLNITTLPHSTYNVIGLEGACWEWNEIAEKTFGLTGKECGVIAQEVKKLYPCAVTRGKDGYLLVRYDKLHEIINTRHGNKYPTEC